MPKIGGMCVRIKLAKYSMTMHYKMTFISHDETLMGCTDIWYKCFSPHKTIAHLCAHCVHMCSIFHSTIYLRCIPPGGGYGGIPGGGIGGGPIPPPGGPIPPGGGTGGGGSPAMENKTCIST